MRNLAVKLLIVSLFVSCVNHDDKEEIKEIILYGHSGFRLLDSTKYIFDSTSLDIREYFEYKKDSILRVAIRSYKKKTAYFKVNSKDTVGLSTIFNNLLLLNLQSADYYFSEPEIYDGFYYSLNIITTKYKNIKINYVPFLLSSKLKGLHNFIRNIIYSSNNEPTEYFPFDKILKEDALKIFNRNPPPPAPERLPKIKF
jgi:hypothetical protein